MDLVHVRRQPTSDQVAGVPLDKLEGVSWSDQMGGAKSVQRRTGQWFIRVHFPCTEILEGEIAHSCTHGDAPHVIRACVCKKDNDPVVYGKLLDVVGPKPSQKPLTNAQYRQWLKAKIAEAHAAEGHADDDASGK